MGKKFTRYLEPAVRLTLVCTIPLLILACEQRPIVDPPEESGGVGAVEVARPAPEPSPESLPAFEDYPVAAVFTDAPAPVDLDSHADAGYFRTALTVDAETGAREARFAGHYRIVHIGCGTSCQAVWAVDLADGSAHSLFTASNGTVFRADSRLIIENDPASYEDLVAEMPIADVEHTMEVYGPPRFWVENEGEFERIGPTDLRIDPQTKRVVAAPSVDSSESKP